MSKRYNTKEASDLLASWGTPFTVGTLETWRALKRGPAYVKIRSRVFYTERCLRDFSQGFEIKTTDSHILSMRGER